MEMMIYPELPVSAAVAAAVIDLVGVIYVRALRPL